MREGGDRCDSEDLEGEVHREREANRDGERAWGLGDGQGSMKVGRKV